MYIYINSIVAYIIFCWISILSPWHAYVHPRIPSTLTLALVTRCMTSFMAKAKASSKTGTEKLVETWKLIWLKFIGNSWEIDSWETHGKSWEIHGKILVNPDLCDWNSWEIMVNSCHTLTLPHLWAAMMQFESRKNMVREKKQRQKSDPLWSAEIVVLKSLWCWNYGPIALAPKVISHCSRNL